MKITTTNILPAVISSSIHIDGDAADSVAGNEHTIDMDAINLDFHNNSSASNNTLENVYHTVIDIPSDQSASAAGSLSNENLVSEFLAKHNCKLSSNGKQLMVMTPENIVDAEAQPEIKPERLIKIWHQVLISDENDKAILMTAILPCLIEHLTEYLVKKGPDSITDKLKKYLIYSVSLFAGKDIVIDDLVDTIAHFTYAKTPNAPQIKIAEIVAVSLNGLLMLVPTLSTYIPKLIQNIKDKKICDSISGIITILAISALFTEPLLIALGSKYAAAIGSVGNILISTKVISLFSDFLFLKKNHSDLTSEREGINYCAQNAAIDYGFNAGLNSVYLSSEIGLSVINLIHADGSDINRFTPSYLSLCAIIGAVFLASKLKGNKYFQQFDRSKNMLNKECDYPEETMLLQTIVIMGYNTDAFKGITSHLHGEARIKSQLGLTKLSSEAEVSFLTHFIESLAKINELNIDNENKIAAISYLNAIYRGEDVSGTTGSKMLDTLLKHIENLHQKDTRCCTNLKKGYKADAVYNNVIAPVMEAMAYMDRCSSIRLDGSEHSSHYIQTANVSDLPNQPIILTDILGYENEQSGNPHLIQVHHNSSSNNGTNLTSPNSSTRSSDNSSPVTSLTTLSSSALEATSMMNQQYTVHADGTVELKGYLLTKV